MEQMWQALFSRAKHAHHCTSMMPIDLERLMFLKVIQHFWIRDSVMVYLEEQIRYHYLLRLVSPTVPGINSGHFHRVNFKICRDLLEVRKTKQLNVNIMQ